MSLLLFKIVRKEIPSVIAFEGGERKMGDAKDKLLQILRRQYIL